MNWLLITIPVATFIFGVYIGFRHYKYKRAEIITKLMELIAESYLLLIKADKEIIEKRRTIEVLKGQNK